MRGQPATGRRAAPNDMTVVATGEGPTAVFIAVDHCSAECLGIHASARATRHEALEPSPISRVRPHRVKR